jgi:hypothetical protein
MKNLAEYVSSIFQPVRFSTLAMTDYSASSFRSPSQSGSFQKSGFQFKKFQRYFKNSRYLTFAIVVVVVFIIAIVGISSVVRKSTTNATPTSAATSQQQANIAKPIATETLNKTFQFPLKDATGKTVSNIQYEIISAEFDNQVVVKGQLATAIQGKTFLVLNLQITNSYDKAVQLNTRDYIRLVVDGNKNQKLAATIHNDPVDVEPISTTFTRLGFPVSTNFKTLALEVGQIDGSKQTIPLTIQY